MLKIAGWSKNKKILIAATVIALSVLALFLATVSEQRVTDPVETIGDQTQDTDDALQYPEPELPEGAAPSQIQFTGPED